MEIQIFKEEFYCLKDIKDKEATLVLEDDDLRIEYAFPLKEAMCMESVNYPSLYDRLRDYGCIDRDNIVSELEHDANSHAYESKVWERDYDFEDEIDDKNSREDLQDQYEDNDGQKPFAYGIGGGWFEFPDDVFEKDKFIFSVKRELYFLDGKEVDFETIKEIVNDWNKCKFYWVNHPKKYNIETKEDLLEFFEHLRKND